MGVGGTRFYWLLATMLKNKGIDPKHIDSSLTYNENKQLLEQKFGRLNLRSSNPMTGGE